MNYPSKIDDCKTFETMALNILYIKENEILLAYIKTLKHNLTTEKQVILLMITNDKRGCHYIAVKKTIYIIMRIKIKTC